MNEIDLDINNYTLNDLERFFKFKKNSKYLAKDVELRETQIRQQLLGSGHIDKRMKRDLIEFLEKAKNIIISANCPPPRQPTVLPRDYPLDPSDFPGSRIPPSREEELTVRPKTQYIYSQNSDFFPGEINPLKTRVISKCLTIDTRFRDNFYTTTSTDFTFQMPLKINKVVSMQLSSFEIPVSFYGISSKYGNNFLYLKITHPSHEYDDEPVEEERYLIIPDGNYNGQDLIDKINDLLCPRSFDGAIMYPDNLFSYIEFFLDVSETGSGTGKVTIRTTGVKASEITKITMDFTKDIHGNSDNIDVSSKIGWNLGFTQKIYDGEKEYISDTLIEPATIRYIYLAVDDFNNSVNNHFVTAFNQSILNPNIIARISIKGTYFSLLMENDLNVFTEPRIYFGPVDIQRLRVRLFDDHGRILDMNNANYSFCLVFKILYDL
jgi:hypothetical protein